LASLSLAAVKAHLSELVQPRRPPARRGTYRVLYRIDDAHHRVTVVRVVQRSDAYR
jgi:mRNA-degrading endonuclease RelE of RelBE toxin-antitoxin system